MTNQIEKEFFEAIGVEPKVIEEHYITDCFLKDNVNKCPHFSCGFGEILCCNPKKYNFEEYPYPYTYFKGCCPNNVNFKTIPREVVYPRITPEIILKLDDLVFNQDYGLVIDEDCYCYFDNTTCDRQAFWGDTKAEALLKLCTKLAPEIKEEVQKLFKGG